MKTQPKANAQNTPAALAARIAASAARSAIGTVVSISAQPMWALNV